MASYSPLKRFLVRTATSLAAIAAVSVIFGVKAYEIERRSPTTAFATPLTSATESPGLAR